jgi:hypothetical protein
MENIPKQKEVLISKEREELSALEKEGNYVFHGTSEDVEELVPQQAVDIETGPDRKPSIFASTTADFAIFHAIINGKNCHNVIAESGAVTHEDGSYELKFGLPRAALDNLPDSASGWVYVFDKKSFTPIEGRVVECESRRVAVPVKKIKVFKRDLPQYIEILG